MVGFSNPVQIGDVRTAMDRIGFGKAEIKTFGTERDILIRTAEQGEGTTVGDRIRAGSRQSFPDNPFTVLKEDKIGPKIGAELRRDAIYAIIASLIAILLYVAFRFKFIYGVGAVVALFHDVLVTLGIISIFDGLTPHLNLEISQNMIAAFLTLVGLSVNDTVVIFDRIRENQKIFRTHGAQELINKSLNETLSRTIITIGHDLRRADRAADLRRRGEPGILRSPCPSASSPEHIPRSTSPAPSSWSGQRGSRQVRRVLIHRPGRRP